MMTQSKSVFMFCFAALLGLIIHVNPVRAEACHNQKDQNSQNRCMQLRYSDAQKKLDELVLQVTQSYFKESEFFKTYLKNWIVFRDAHCEKQAEDWGAGSMAVFIQFSCMDRLTSAKVSELLTLQNYAKDL